MFGPFLDTTLFPSFNLGYVNLTNILLLQTKDYLSDPGMSVPQGTCSLVLCQNMNNQKALIQESDYVILGMSFILVGAVQKKTK
jgi:hypothetical protein